MKRAIPQLVAAALLIAPAAAAHDGPPYAVLVDQPVGDRLIEVWTDPDIGTGTYWIVLSRPGGGEPPTPPDALEVCVAPKSQPGNETCWPARREKDAPLQFLAEVPFSEGGWWTTRVVLRDGDQIREATVDVEVTPPGVGRIGFLIYLFPFVAFGFLFLRLALKRRRLRRGSEGV